MNFKILTAVVILVSVLHTAELDRKAAQFVDSYVSYMTELSEYPISKKKLSNVEIFQIIDKRRSSWNAALISIKNNNASYDSTSKQIFKNAVFVAENMIQTFDSELVVFKNILDGKISKGEGEMQSAKLINKVDQLWDMYFQGTMLLASVIVDMRPDKKGHASFSVLTTEEKKNAIKKLELFYGEKIKNEKSTGQEIVPAIFVRKLLLKERGSDERK